MSAQEPPVPVTVADAFTIEPATHTEHNGRSSLTEIRLSLEQSVVLIRPTSLIARRTLGIVLLMITVFLWTASNFLASDIFADATYAKPYFVTYINTSFFAITLIPIAINIIYKQGYSALRSSLTEYWRDNGYSRAPQEDTFKSGDTANLSSSSAGNSSRQRNDTGILPGEDGERDKEGEDVLSIWETASLSLEFCMLWFTANYFVAACLQYTTVASSTILTSTSSIWTLLFGALFHVERFSSRKLVGVLASLVGITLISMVDLGQGDNEGNRGKFPYKTRADIAIGDAMAFISAIMYGIYAVVMKKRIGNEERVNMPLFFGLVGLFNVLLLWPGFIILHFTGVEKFELPDTSRVWNIIFINSISSLVSDFTWAYAMLLTTPLVVTVGLSLTIPLSLIGQILLSDQYSSGLYWVGAAVVLASFVFVNRESGEEVKVGDRDGVGAVERV